jgi:gluconokinase
MQYIIGIDIGTTNTKAVAFTDQGEVLGSTGASYPVFSDPSGRHELDPDQLLAAFLTVLREIRQQTHRREGSAEVREGLAGGQEGLAGIREGLAGIREGLAGISFSCAMHSLIAVDGKGRPLTRAITWADRRSEAYATALKASEAGRRIYRRTGTPIHPMSPLSKLLWLKDKEPGIFRDAARFISIKEYIWWRLSGLYEVDHSIASATGLLDIYTFDWYPESLELAGIRPEQLSRPVPCTHLMSGLLPEYQRSLGLPEGLPFIIGGSDGCLANLGSGALLPGETALTIGTSGAVRMTAAKPEYDPKERTFNYILTEQLYVAGGATNNGGNAVQWYIEHFLGEKGDTAAWVAKADSVAPGCEGLVFLPYLLGERAPVWNADARGMFFGIRSIHEQRHFMRSVLEGISYSLYQIGTSLEETIGPIQHIYASGGFTRSATWLQMIADVFLKKVYVTGVADASAIGACIMGFYALGVAGTDVAGADSLIRVKDVYEPDEARHRIYQENFMVFSVLYDRLKDLM